MRLKNRIFPYPVITEKENTAYVHGHFQTNIEADQAGYDVVLNVISDLTDEKLNRLLKEGKTEFVYHIECPLTAFRKIYRTSNRQYNILVSKDDLKGVVQFCSFLVAKKDIPRYLNDKLDPFYASTPFHFEKNMILGIGGQADIPVREVHQPLQKASSIFIIYPDAGRKDMMVTLGDRINIYLPKESYDLYRSLEISDVQDTLHAMIIVPALMTALAEMADMKKDDGSVDVWKEKTWSNTISSTCNELGLSLDDIDNPNTRLELAQKILKHPIIGGISYVYEKALGGEDNEQSEIS